MDRCSSIHDSKAGACFSFCPASPDLKGVNCGGSCFLRLVPSILLMFIFINYDPALRFIGRNSFIPRRNSITGTGTILAGGSSGRGRLPAAIRGNFSLASRRNRA